MAYTSITKVRQISGFVGNSNIGDAFIQDLITRAENYINSYVGDVYTLPLPTFYKNTIVWTGTGDDSGNLDIIINGTTYTVAVTSGMTSAQAADAFRVAAADSDDFIIAGPLGNGTTVTIYTRSQTGTAAQVTTDATTYTTHAITAAVGGIGSQTVGLIETIATEIAGAYLLIEEYGPESQDTDKDGFKKLDLWTEVLERIQSKEEKLYDFVGNELSKSNTQSLAFFPADGSEDADGNPVENKFSMNKKF